MGKDNPLINKNLRELLSHILPSAVILDNPEYDNAIIGLTDNAVIYDYNKMVADVIEQDDVSYTDACDFVNNTLKAVLYMGNNKPIIMTNNILTQTIKERCN